MDYHIGFPPSSTAAIVLRDLAGASGDVIRAAGEGVWRIGPRAILQADSADPQAAILRSGDDAALFTLLSLYFRQDAGSEGGLLVVPLGTSAPLLVAITNDPETGPGRTPAGFNVAAAELLASPQAFATVWRVIIGTDDGVDGIDETDEETVATGHAKAQMLMTPFLSDDPGLSRTASFLVFGAKPAGLMRDILRVAGYSVRDPGFLVHHLPNPHGMIEAIGFGTSEGPAIELRVPLPARTVADATAALAAAARSQGATVLFVTDIIDEEETFIVQAVLPGGRRGAPRRIKMQ